MTQTPTPTPTPTPEVLGPIDRSDPELGIVFTELPVIPEDTPEAADLRDAIDAYTWYQAAVWTGLTTGELPPDLVGYAADNMIAQAQERIDQETAAGGVLGGTSSYAVSVVSADEMHVVLDVCIDYADVTWNVDGESSFAYRGTDDESGVARYGLGRNGHLFWLVESIVSQGPC